MQRSAQVVDALLTLAAQLHVAPQEGETLAGREGLLGKRNWGGAGAKLNGSRAAAAYLQDQGMALCHVLLRRHVEEGEAHAQAVQRVVGVSLEGLDILTCKAQSLRVFSSSCASETVFFALVYTRHGQTMTQGPYGAR